MYSQGVNASTGLAMLSDMTNELFVDTLSHFGLKSILSDVDTPSHFGLKSILSDVFMKGSEITMSSESIETPNRMLDKLILGEDTNPDNLFLVKLMKKVEQGIDILSSNGVKLSETHDIKDKSDSEVEIPQKTCGEGAKMVSCIIDKVTLLKDSVLNTIANGETNEAKEHFEQYKDPASDGSSDSEIYPTNLPAVGLGVRCCGGNRVEPGPLLEFLAFSTDDEGDENVLTDLASVEDSLIDFADKTKGLLTSGPIGRLIPDQSIDRDWGKYLVMGAKQNLTQPPKDVAQHLLKAVRFFSNINFLEDP